MNSSAAISRFVRPAATSAAICVSVRVSELGLLLAPARRSAAGAGAPKQLVRRGHPGGRGRVGEGHAGKPLLLGAWKRKPR